MITVKMDKNGWVRTELLVTNIKPFTIKHWILEVAIRTRSLQRLINSISWLVAFRRIPSAPSNGTSTTEIFAFPRFPRRFHQRNNWFRHGNMCVKIRDPRKAWFIIITSRYSWMIWGCPYDLRNQHGNRWFPKVSLKFSPSKSLVSPKKLLVIPQLSTLQPRRFQSRTSTWWDPAT